MSRIRHADSSTIIATYDAMLQMKISSVISKIGFDDSGVTWVIFDPEKNYPNTIIGSLLFGTRGSDYGFYDETKNEIWISTKTIRSGCSEPIMAKRFYFSRNISSIQPDLLADVILDEITHFQTSADHGTSKYDNKLKANREKYYNF